MTDTIRRVRINPLLHPEVAEKHLEWMDRWPVSHGILIDEMTYFVISTLRDAFSKALESGKHRPPSNEMHRVRVFPHLDSDVYDLHYSWLLRVSHSRQKFSHGKLLDQLTYFVATSHRRTFEAFMETRHSKPLSK